MAAVLAQVLFSGPVAAAPDQFIGDSAIYTGSSTHNMPNVLLIIDNSNATLNTASGTSYNPGHNYMNDGCASASGGCYSTLSVYQAGTQGDYSHNSAVDNPTGTLATKPNGGSLPNVSCSNNGDIVEDTLLAAGTYSGAGTTNYPNLKFGACDTGPKGYSYALGNFLNYTLMIPPKVLVQGTDGQDYMLIKSHTSTVDDQPVTGANWATYWQLNGAHVGTTPAWAVNTPYALGTDTQQKIIYDAVKTVVKGARFAVKFGAMIYGSNNKGGHVVSQIQNLTVDNDFNKFLGTLPGGSPGAAVLNSQTARPQAEALYDAWDYFKGHALTISGQAAMPSPSTKSCDKNYIILLTNGLPNGEDPNQLGPLVGDYDHDGMDAAAYGAGTHYLDDTAKKIYEEPLSYGQRIITNTVLAFQADDPLIRRTADVNHGRGSYFVVNNAGQLAAALNNILNNIVLEADTSYVAPVVPVSPENRIYSGTRVYMGFFQPISEHYWLGNLKKYGIDDSGNLADSLGNKANYVDMNADGKDDRDGTVLPSGATNGSFRSAAQSYWSTSADGELVASGGAGSAFLSRDFTSSTSGSNPRKIYTYLGTNTNLTQSVNAFKTTNAGITAATLGLPGPIITTATATDVSKLINFVHGVDVYDENVNGNTTEKRGRMDGSNWYPWIFGDILHSKPLVINYQTYTFTSDAEKDCNTNKTTIYVGSNDGMLHAFNDCDGSEAWAFIPPNVLPNLQYLTGKTHTYFMDSSVVAYVYDKNHNGNIETPDDKVILIVGQRRGGGVNTAPATGSYYALDVSNPATPTYLWSLSSATGGFSELGETWSEPKVGKVKLSGGNALVAFIGGGYDNCNEDARYGATQLFTGACVGGTYTNDGGVDGSGVGVTSGGAAGPSNPKGRGIFAVQIATLDSDGSPTISAAPTSPLSYTSAGFSIASEIIALDTNYDDYIDTLYVGDTGGNVWRFTVGTTSLTATKLFSSNATNTGDAGRKIFYKPSATIEVGSVWVYFGTGDREHPLNMAVQDRLYGFIDKGQMNTKTETDLVDVTEDLLQAGGDSQVTSTLAALADPNKFGWYIKLNQDQGEKVLAAPTLFNKAVYFSTFTPNSTANADPCKPGNLGTGRIYAVDYKTGEAVINFDKTNDSFSTTNKRATPVDGQVLLRNDRVAIIGDGIPSGVVVGITANGEPSAFIGAGGAIVPVSVKPDYAVLPLYWRQK